jgi:L-cystine uptake protein TcyP (sodium:dicarboxylate symporter family)
MKINGEKNNNETNSTITLFKSFHLLIANHIRMILQIGHTCYTVLVCMYKVSETRCLSSIKRKGKTIEKHLKRGS